MNFIKLSFLITLISFTSFKVLSTSEYLIKKTDIELNFLNNRSILNSTQDNISFAEVLNPELKHSAKYYSRPNTTVPQNGLYPLDGYENIKILHIFFKTLEKSSSELEDQYAKFLEFLSSEPEMIGFLEKIEDEPFINKNFFSALMSNEGESQKTFEMFKGRLHKEFQILEPLVPKYLSSDIKYNIVSSYLKGYAKEVILRLGQYLTFQREVNYILQDSSILPPLIFLDPVYDDLSLSRVDFLYFFYEGYSEEIHALQDALLIYKTGGDISGESITGFGITPSLFGIYMKNTNVEDGFEAYNIVDSSNESKLEYLEMSYYLYDISRQYLRELSLESKKYTMVNDPSRRFLNSEISRLDGCRNHIYDLLPPSKLSKQKQISLVEVMRYHLLRTKNSELISNFESNILSQA